MLNLLINLNKHRGSADRNSGNLLVMSAFLAGAVLFWLFGKELYDSGAVVFSQRNFSFAFSAAMLFVMLSAFSQLGPIQLATLDAAFEFAVCCFALSEFLNGINPNTVPFLLFKLFALIFLAMLLSKRAEISSIRLLGVLKSDNKRIGEFVLNSSILAALVFVLLIICLKAF